MRMKTLGALCLLAGFICSAAWAGRTTGSAPAVTSNKPVDQPPPLSGRWYMGTAAGFDCNLVIRPDHTLTVQYGGCFSQGPLMTSAWNQAVDKVAISDSALRQKLGAYLSVTRYKGYVLLVPENEQAYVAARGYNRAHCFWPNLLSAGLQWPKEVSDFDKGRPKKRR